MASTTYEHFVDTNKMYATHERFLGITKTYHLGNVNKLVTFCHRFASIGNMVRNAGQPAAAFLARCCLWRRLVWCCPLRCENLTDSR